MDGIRIKCGCGNHQRRRIEQLGGDAFLSQSTYRITIRWISGITTAMRVNWGGRLFNIANTNDIEGRNRVLELTCTEGLSHGN